MNTDTVLITGASSGIGEALAENFARDGYDLVLVARSEDKLLALKRRLAKDYKIEVLVEPADLSRRGAAKKLVTTLGKIEVQVDILVNCAGVLEHGSFVELSGNAHQGLIDLNISGYRVWPHTLRPRRTCCRCQNHLRKS